MRAASCVAPRSFASLNAFLDVSAADAAAASAIRSSLVFSLYVSLYMAGEYFLMFNELMLLVERHSTISYCDMLPFFRSDSEEDEPLQ